MNSANRYYSREELATIFNVSQQTISNWANSIKEFKKARLNIGKTIRFKKEIIDLFIQNNEGKTTDEN